MHFTPHSYGSQARRRIPGYAGRVGQYLKEFKGKKPQTKMLQTVPKAPLSQRFFGTSPLRRTPSGIFKQLPTEAFTSTKKIAQIKALNLKQSLQTTLNTIKSNLTKTVLPSMQRSFQSMLRYSNIPKQYSGIVQQAVVTHVNELFRYTSRMLLRPGLGYILGGVAFYELYNMTGLSFINMITDISNSYAFAGVAPVALIAAAALTPAIIVAASYYALGAIIVAVTSNTYHYMQAVGENVIQANQDQINNVISGLKELERVSARMQEPHANLNAINQQLQIVISQLPTLVQENIHNSLYDIEKAIDQAHTKRNYNTRQEKELFQDAIGTVQEQLRNFIEPAIEVKEFDQ